MAYQRPLPFRNERWHLARRSLHVVARSDAAGYTIRVRWSQRLGLQLDHVFFSHAEALNMVDRINLRGFIHVVNWKRIFNPKWTPTCRTLRSI